MVLDDDQGRSIWLREGPRTAFAPLKADHRVDVAVVGGGIVGLTTALLLRRAGHRVALLEARRIGQGVTGASTAKVTALHGAVYARVERTFGEAAARVYGEANRAGVARMVSLAEEFRAAGEDCCLEEQSAFTWTSDPGKVAELRDEAAAAERAGLPATFTTDTELPLAVQGAVRLDGQAQVDPYRYCVALANACVREGVEVYENSSVHDVKLEGDAVVCHLHQHGLQLRASHVVVATLLPFLDRGGFFARTHPSRSYALAATLERPPPQGMYINVDSPTRSVRPLPDGQGLIVVGEQHKVGQDQDTRQRYAALEAWARQHFPVASIDHRWSSQDYLAADGLPFIGRMPGNAGRVLTVTGLGKWGLSAGTAGAMILDDLIAGRENPWASLFDAGRVNLTASAGKLLSENANVARRFVGDRLATLDAPGIEELAPGDGGIVRDGGSRLAAYRDEHGDVYACSPVCTHMGCLLQWNTAEKSWDCPCHGSRFDVRGQVLQGPASHALEVKQQPSQPPGERP